MSTQRSLQVGARGHLGLTCALGLLLVLEGAASAQPTPSDPAPPPPADAVEDPEARSLANYQERARRALDGGNPLLAGQILMLAHHDFGDLDALYVAGLAFQSANRRDLTIAAWARYLCLDGDPLKLQEIRIAWPTLTGGQSAPPCQQSPGPSPAHVAEAAPPRAQPRPAPHPYPAQPRPAEPSGDPSVQMHFELESGVRFGDNTLGLVWSPGLWFDSDSKLALGLFAPVFIGARPAGDSSLGIEPRLRLALSESISGELGIGFHAIDGLAESSYSLSGGINFDDVLSVRLIRERFSGGSFAEFGEFEPTGTFIDATFTGKSGTTIAAIEAVLALTVFALASGG